MKLKVERGQRDVCFLRGGAVLLALFLFFGCGSGGGGLTGGGPGQGGTDPGEPPHVFLLEPEDGPITGGEHITIHGDHFTVDSPMSVFFGSAQATDVVVKDPNTITCVASPHAAGTVHILVNGDHGYGILPKGFTYKTDPSILWLTCERNGNDLDFRWEVSEPGDEIVFHRGSTPVEYLEGDREEYTFQESVFGLIRYTFVLHYRGRRVDERDLIVDLGRVMWDPPSAGPWDGFYLYVAKAISSNPYNLLPYNDPSNFSIDVGLTPEISLGRLYGENLINGKDAYFMAASTYAFESSIRKISPLTPPVFVIAKAVLGQP
jgi:hypothetical protein